MTLMCIFIKITNMSSSWCKDLVTLAKYLKSVAHTHCVSVVMSLSREAKMIVIFKLIVAERFKGLMSKLDKNKL